MKSNSTYRFNFCLNINASNLSEEFHCVIANFRLRVSVTSSIRSLIITVKWLERSSKNARLYLALLIMLLLGSSLNNM